MTNEVILGVVCSVIGAAIWAFGSTLYTYLRYYKGSEYSGDWEDDIPKTSHSPAKKDIFSIKHNKRTNELKGTIRRISPEEQSNRNWSMSGVINDGYFIASFWHDGPQKSNGCVYAKLIKDNTFEGFYLEEHEGEIDKTPITLKKRS